MEAADRATQMLVLERTKLDELTKALLERAEACTGRGRRGWPGILAIVRLQQAAPVRARSCQAEWRQAGVVPATGVSGVVVSEDAGSPDVFAVGPGSPGPRVLRPWLPPLQRQPHRCWRHRLPAAAAAQSRREAWRRRSPATPCPPVAPDTSADGSTTGVGSTSPASSVMVGALPRRFGVRLSVGRSSLAIHRLPLAPSVRSGAQGSAPPQPNSGRKDVEERCLVRADRGNDARRGQRFQRRRHRRREAGMEGASGRLDALRGADEIGETAPNAANSAERRRWLRPPGRPHRQGKGPGLDHAIDGRALHRDAGSGEHRGEVAGRSSPPGWSRTAPAGRPACRMRPASAVMSPAADRTSRKPASRSAAAVRSPTAKAGSGRSAERHPSGIMAMVRGLVTAMAASPVDQGPPVIAGRNKRRHERLVAAGRQQGGGAPGLRLSPRHQDAHQAGPKKPAPPRALSSAPARGRAPRLRRAIPSAGRHGSRCHRGAGSRR